MSELLELADRCEKASGPDRELDAAIGRGTGWQQASCPIWGIGAPHWSRDGKSIREIIGYWEGHTHGTLPFFTASLDAAMTLLPDAWILTLTVYHDASHARLVDDRINPVRLDDVEVEAETPALALCAAALRARAGQPS